MNKLEKQLNILRMIEQLLEQLERAGLSLHGVGYLKHYIMVVRKYEALKVQGLDHWEICEMIGVSEKHMYKIIKITSKLNNINN
jgi:hypothetical protein